MSEDLLDVLARDARARPGRRVGAKLTLALTAGAIVSLAGVLLLLGPRSDLRAASASPMFWMKLAYPLAVATIAAACVERLARPPGEARRRLPWLAAPIAVMALGAGAQWLRAPAPARHELLMGSSAMVCPWLIAGCAVPLLAALVWALRGLAPTRLAAAGAMAGLTAGALGAAIYALHCGETGGAFVLVWYSLGMVTPALAGLVLGRRLLRWR